MTVDAGSSSTGQLQDHSAHRCKVKERVTVYKLDNLWKQANLRSDVITLLKVDVQGYELDVFRGARSLLENGVISWILFEVLAGGISGALLRIKETLSLIHSFGYVCFDTAYLLRTAEHQVYDGKTLTPATMIETTSGKKEITTFVDWGPTSPEEW